MIVFVNPNVIVQRSDLLTTGIPYMPIGLAYLASQLRQDGCEIKVIDAFGEDPWRYRKTEQFLIRGLSAPEVVSRLPREVEAVFVYAGTVASHQSTLRIIQEIRRAHGQTPIIVFENSQAVYAYSLSHAVEEFRKAGASYILTGEPELVAPKLLEDLRQGKKPKHSLISHGPLPDIDRLPFPAWDLLPLANYWRLGYAHGPVEGRFLPLVTSRGCPYPCRFCIIPETTDGKWRGRAAAGVVDEMEQYGRRFSVKEFHIEDLNPTIQESRIRVICEEILRRKLDVRWKIVAGTKIETLAHLDTLDLMARAGCRYLSFSPETGSPRLLKLINKPFRWDFALEQTARMNSLGIRSQACFVLGFPGETDEDRAQTRDYVKKLVHAGLDEIALFIVAPIAGSDIFERFERPDNLSQMTFSPSWREDYGRLNRFRLRLYAAFLIWKILSYPAKIGRQAVNFLTRRFETKMEMVPYRGLCEFIESFRAVSEENGSCSGPPSPASRERVG